MSDFEQPPVPPLPPRGPVRALPVTPVPAEPVPERYVPPPPIPPRYVAGAYGVAASPTRPGIVTGIGVTSIVIACLSILASGISGCTGIIFFKQAQYVARTTRANASVQTALAQPTQARSPQQQGGSAWDPAGVTFGPVVEANGLAERDRLIVLGALETMEVLTPERTRQAHAILAKAGRDILPLEASDITAAGVRAAIRDHGVGLNPDPLMPAPIFFETSAGTLSLYDDRAQFRPNDGTPSVSAAANPADDAPMPAPASPATPPKATASAKPQTGPVDPFADDPFAEDPAPRAQPATQASKTVLPIAKPPPPPPAARVAIHPMAMVLVIGEGMMSGGLAIFLLTSGILTLRDHPWGKRLHQIYAAAKIPLAVVAATGFLWLVGELSRSLEALGNGVPPEISTFKVWAVSISALGAIYPIALLIALSARSVTAYFNENAAGAARRVF